MTYDPEAMFYTDWLSRRGERRMSLREKAVVEMVKVRWPGELHTPDEWLEMHRLARKVVKAWESAESPDSFVRHILERD